MRRFVWLTPILITACASAGPLSEEAARQMYVRAVDLRFEGDLQASNDLLIEIAHRGPDTRAGHKARALVAGGSLATTMAVAGILAAVAIPNFIRYQHRSKQAAGRRTASQVRMQLEAHRAETGAYVGAARSFSEPAGDYVIVYGPDRVLPDTAEAWALMERARPVWTGLDSEPFIRRLAYRVLVAGDPDDDGEVDLWMVDSEADEVAHIADDLPD